MHDAKVGNERIIHVLPEQGSGVEGVEGDSIGPAMDTAVSAVRPVIQSWGEVTALADPIVTSWVLFHRCEERAEGMSRRLSFGWHAGRRT